MVYGGGEVSAMTKPNLMLPTDLWGEVKVAAYRRGCKPVELVIEVLSKAFPVSRNLKNVPGRTGMMRKP